MEYYLAVDIGASSGRHILGSVENGKMKLEEIYRFENGFYVKNGSKYWNTESLFDEIVNGMKKCREIGKIPKSIAIDTWGVDYALLDADGNLTDDVFCYRDSRTDGMAEAVSELIGEDALYARTGIQRQPFNTLYQLMSAKKVNPASLEKADCLLFLPNYFNFLLTGVRKSEYTIASTSQMLDAKTKQWDTGLIELLGLPAKIFQPLCMPGTFVGRLKPELAEEIGFDLDVICCCGHDTASAVMAAPDGGIYISSGTWSLMGIETPEPVCTEQSRISGFTNEGGYDYRFRYLENIMGLWIIQSVRRETGNKYSFAELCTMAEESSKTFSSVIDANDEGFLAPDNMTEQIRSFCKNSGQKVPETVGEIAYAVYQGLAECYAKCAAVIEENTGKTYDCINIIGGGSNADYLNRLTAAASGKKVRAGIGEATSVGNIAAQAIRAGALSDLADARSCIFNSFAIKEYE